MKILLAADGSSFTQHVLAFLAARPELLGGDRTHTALIAQCKTTVLLIRQ